MSLEKEIAEQNSDRIADILWWVKGRIDSGNYIPFDRQHEEALHEAKKYFDKISEETEE